MKAKKRRIENIRRLFPARGYGFWAAGMAIFLFGVSSFTPAQTALQNNPSEESGNYRIGIGDVLKIEVFKQTILSDEIRVGNDGNIRMKMLDEPIPAACQTEAELSSAISSRYKKYILNPQVYVAVKEFNANPIAIGGAVVAPGIFQLKRPMRLLDLLAFVNGPAANAGESIQIIRSGSALRCGQKSNGSPETLTTDESASEQEILSLSLKDLMKGKASANPFLQGGDIIRVSQAEVKQAFIIGNVKTPMTVDLKEPVPLSRAIAMAGGFSQGAKTDKIRIKRQIPGSLEPKVLIVNLKESSKTKPEDILLEPNDVIEVPGPKPNIIKDIFKSIIPTLTGVPILIP